LNADDFPNWIDYGKLGIQLLFDDRSYKEMRWALNELVKTDSKRLVELQEKILGFAEPTFVSETYSLYCSGPSAGGGARTSITPESSTASILIDRKVVEPQVKIEIF